MKHSPDEKAYRKEEPVKSHIDDDDGEDELVYHIDYHGVTTHPYKPQSSLLRRIFTTLYWSEILEK